MREQRFDVMCKELEQIQRTYSSYGRNLILVEYIKLLLNNYHNFFSSWSLLNSFAFSEEFLNVFILCMVSLTKFLECFW